MRKNALIFAISLSLMIITSGCTRTTTDDPKDLKIVQLQEQISSYENEIYQLKEENENYKEFVDSSIQFLDKEEMAELAKSCWRYEISLDDTKINLNDVNKMNHSNFEIAFSEKMNSIPSMEQALLDNGAIIGNFYDHLTFVDIQPTKAYISDGTVVQGMHYEFENVPKGSIIKIQVTDELKERLDLEDNVINIEVN